MAHEHLSLNGSGPPLIETAGAPFLAVMFLIAGQRYGISVALVREVVSIPALVPIAGAPPYLRGLLNLRGLFLPVLDGRVLVSAEALLDLSHQVMIIGSAEPEFGLVVDQAESVRQVTVVPGSAIARWATLPLFEHMLSDGASAAFHVDIAGLRTLLARTPFEAPLP